MNEERAQMSISEAKQRAWEAANKLEAVIEEFNNEPGEENPARRDYLASQCMSLLAKRFAIPAPVSAKKDTE